MTFIIVEFEIKGVPGFVFDNKGKAWRLPFKSENGRYFGAKKLEPVWDRNYSGYRYKNKMYSLRFIDKNKIRRCYKISTKPPV